jgi:hypothetical protein
VNPFLSTVNSKTSLGILKSKKYFTDQIYTIAQLTSARAKTKSVNKERAESYKFIIFTSSARKRHNILLSPEAQFCGTLSLKQILVCLLMAVKQVNF